MLGMWNGYAGPFLQVASALTLALGAPMMITPLGWARVLQWKTPAETDLTVYFGRCLGGVVTVLAIFGFFASTNPTVQPFFFQVMLSAVGLNILIHIYGALKKIQPLTETIEIGAWVLLFIAGILFYPIA